MQRRIVVACECLELRSNVYMLACPVAVAPVEYLAFKQHDALAQAVNADAAYEVVKLPPFDKREKIRYRVEFHVWIPFVLSQFAQAVSSVKAVPFALKARFSSVLWVKSRGGPR
jgi:hypothetical protein